MISSFLNSQAAYVDKCPVPIRHLCSQLKIKKKRGESPPRPRPAVSAGHQPSGLPQGAAQSQGSELCRKGCRATTTIPKPLTINFGHPSGFTPMAAGLGPLSVKIQTLTRKPESGREALARISIHESVNEDYKTLEHICERQRGLADQRDNMKARRKDCSFCKWEWLSPHSQTVNCQGWIPAWSSALTPCCSCDRPTAGPGPQPWLWALCSFQPRAQRGPSHQIHNLP